MTRRRQSPWTTVIIHFSPGLFGSNHTCTPWYHRPFISAQGKTSPNQGVVPGWIAGFVNAAALGDLPPPSSCGMSQQQLLPTTLHLFTIRAQLRGRSCTDQGVFHSPRHSDGGFHALTPCPVPVSVDAVAFPPADRVDQHERTASTKAPRISGGWLSDTCSLQGTLALSDSFF